MNLNLDLVPASLDEAVELLIESLSFSELVIIKQSTVNNLHMSVGRYIRNVWSLWEQDTPLLMWFKTQYDITHPDDVSSIILDALISDLNRKPRSTERLVAGFIEHWRIHKNKLKKE